MRIRRLAIGDLAVVLSGGGAPQDQNAFSDSGHPFVRAGALPRLLDGFREQELEKLRPETASQHGLKLFPVGTVLFAKSGMSATKGHVHRLNVPAYVVNHLAALIPRDKRDSSYLVRALERYSPTALIRDLAYPSIRLSDIETFRIDGPKDVVERSRIAAILDQADDLRRKRREALQKLGMLPESIFLDLANSINPQLNKPLGDVIRVRSGEFLPQSDQVSTGQYPVFGGNGINGFHDRYTVEPYTIIVGRVGVYCGAIHVTKEKAWVTDNALIVDIKEPDLIPAYLAAAMKQANLNQYAGRSAQPLISGGRIYPVRIPVPPKPAQEAFAARVAEIDKLKTIHQGHLAKLDELFASLQHRAFRGEL